MFARARAVAHIAGRVSVAVGPRGFPSSSPAAAVAVGVKRHLSLTPRAYAAEAQSIGAESFAGSVAEHAKREDLPCDTDVPVPAKHPGLAVQEKGSLHFLKNPVYSRADLDAVAITHRRPASMRDSLALSSVGFMRSTFDRLTGYPHLTTAKSWLNRIVFLETVAGVPGMVGGMLRHMKSLRGMRTDNQWIHTLLQEAENERMHLLTFIKLRQPGIFFRLAVLVTQGIVFNAFLFFYLVNPRLCHSFVGYLEEEAVRTYTHCLDEIDQPGSAIHLWNKTPAPEIAIEYWKLANTATMRDVIEVVRADEACHRHVNHTFSNMDEEDLNPFSPMGGKKELCIGKDEVKEEWKKRSHS